MQARLPTVERSLSDKVNPINLYDVPLIGFDAQVTFTNEFRQPVLVFIGKESPLRHFSGHENEVKGQYGGNKIQTHTGRRRDASSLCAYPDFFFAYLNLTNVSIKM